MACLVTQYIPINVCTQITNLVIFIKTNQFSYQSKTWSHLCTYHLCMYVVALVTEKISLPDNFQNKTQRYYFISYNAF